MDPDATMIELLDAYSEGDKDRVAELRDALHTWLANGGFPPQIDPTHLLAE